MKTANKVGLVLSGGGYRGAAHAGVIKAMDELGMRPDYISGTSAGAIVGALYAAKHSGEDILKFLKEYDVLSLRNYAFQKPGLFDSAKYHDTFRIIFPEDRFEALPTPLFIATTDLVQSKTQYFYQGELIRPLIASSAVPGVFSPVTIDEQVLCDGGVTNNFPIEPLLTYCDKIIGVYVNPLETVTPKELSKTMSILERAFFILMNTASERKFNQCDVLIEPPKLSQYRLLSKTNLDAIFELGYQEGKRKLEEFQGA